MIPASFSAQIKAEGFLNGKKVNFGGTIRYSRQPFAVRIVFSDLIFGSTLADMLAEQDKIRIMLPIEKVMYVMQPENANLNFFSKLDLEYSVFADAAVSSIPLIKDYTVKRGAGTPDVNAPAMVVLENGSLYETISFVNNIPDKVLLVKKGTKTKVEIYLDKPLQKDGYTFYQKITFVSESTSDRLIVSYKNIATNIPVNMSALTEMAAPGGMRIIIPGK